VGQVLGGVHPLPESLSYPTPGLFCDLLLTPDDEHAAVLSVWESFFEIQLVLLVLYSSTYVSCNPSIDRFDTPERNMPRKQATKWLSYEAGN
jgi:hypothetical protein